MTVSVVAGVGQIITGWNIVLDCPISNKDLSISLALPAPAPPPRRRLLSVNTSMSNSDQFLWLWKKERVESTAFVLLEGVLQAVEVLDMLSWCQTGNLGITRYYKKKKEKKSVTFTWSTVENVFRLHLPPCINTLKTHQKLYCPRGIWHLINKTI